MDRLDQKYPQWTEPVHGTSHPARRADSIDDVARTCEELGLKPKTNPLA